MEATQLDNNINHFEKNKINVYSFRKNQEEFIKNSKSILQAQQRFKSERHTVFTEEINKIALSSNDDKRIQPIDSLETYAYGTSKDLVSEKRRD